MWAMEGGCIKGSVLILVFLLFLTRYRYGQLIEINSHSLFSKWFSEVSIKCFNYWYCQPQWKTMSSVLTKHTKHRSFWKEVGEMRKSTRYLTMIGMESRARRLEGRLHSHALWIWTEGTSTTLWVFSTLKACMPLWWVIQATVNNVPATFPRRFQCCHQWLILFPGSKLTQVIISGVTFTASPWTITDVVSGLHSLGSSSICADL